MMLSKLRIAICGGGSAGLTLARLFQPLTNKIDCVVFERDEHQTVGQQGGSLDLHADYGQRALREAGLFEKFQELAGYDGEALRIIDCFGNVIFDSSQNERPADIRNRPEIDRESLRELLLDSVDPRIIRWGCKIVKVQLGADGQYDVVLSDRIEFGFDVVVGADGAWSKVQPLISSATPSYAGINGVQMEIQHLQVQHAHLSKQIGPGSFYGLGERKSIAGQYCGRGVAQIYVWLLEKESWRDTCGIDWSNAKLAKSQPLHKYFHHWDKDLQDLVVESKGDITPRPIYSLPEDHSWTTSECVTLIGDAAHLMPPFSGIGVNLAMFDAYEVAQAIEKVCNKADLPTKSDLKYALNKFEGKMFARSSRHAQ